MVDSILSQLCWYDRLKPKDRQKILYPSGGMQPWDTRRPAPSSLSGLPRESSKSRWLGWLAPSFLDAAFLFIMIEEFLQELDLPATSLLWLCALSCNSDSSGNRQVPRGLGAEYV